jgi:hypothetical protein
MTEKGDQDDKRRTQDDKKEGILRFAQNDEEAE